MLDLTCYLLQPPPSDLWASQPDNGRILYKVLLLLLFWPLRPPTLTIRLLMQGKVRHQHAVSSLSTLLSIITLAYPSTPVTFWDQKLHHWNGNQWQCVTYVSVEKVDWCPFLKVFPTLFKDEIHEDAIDSLCYPLTFIILNVTAKSDCGEKWTLNWWHSFLLKIKCIKYRCSDTF